MFGLGAHGALEVTDGGAAVRQKRELLVELHPRRVQDLEQAPFGFSVQRLHEAKALARRGLVFVLASEGERTLPDVVSSCLASLRVKPKCSSRSASACV
jgi:hypothetical protein